MSNQPNRSLLTNQKMCVLVNSLAGVQHKMLGIVMLLPGDIKGICNGPDKGKLLVGHHIVFIDELHQAEKNDEFLPLQEAPVNFFGDAPELFGIRKGLPVLCNATTEDNRMVDLQVIVKNNQILIDQVGLQVLPEKGLYDGPGFERNTIL